MSWLLGGSPNRIIHLQRPHGLSFYWSGSWSPGRLVTMTHPEWQSQSQKESTGKEVTSLSEQGHLCPGSLPPSLCPPSMHLLVAFAKEVSITATVPRVQFPGQADAEVTQPHAASLWKVTSSTSSRGRLHAVWYLSIATETLQQSCLPDKPLLRVWTVLTNPVGCRGGCKSLLPRPFNSRVWGEGAYEGRVKLQESSHFFGNYKWAKLIQKAENLCRPIIMENSKKLSTWKKNHQFLVGT